MSRSRRKPKAFVACGRNTEFYRERNRSTRNKNRNILRAAIANGKLDEVQFVENNRNKKFDPWTEPTDGSWMARPEDFPNQQYYEKLLRK